jgi:hypothetical protein
VLTDAGPAQLTAVLGRCGEITRAVRDDTPERGTQRIAGFSDADLGLCREIARRERDDTPDALRATQTNERPTPGVRGWGVVLGV